MGVQQDLQLHRPFFLEAAGKDYLWGGERLRDDFSKNIGLYPLAETWECSTHPDGLSRVRTGPFAGRTLKDVLKEHPEFIGSHPLKVCPEGARTGELPVLVKFIDAAGDLSVQVHPDDEYARIHENGSLGKTEMWYVVDASKDASLIYGFSRDMEKEKLEEALRDGTLTRYLQKVPVRKNDVFFIEAGTVHALCAGSLVVEVQENSNITYRLYDYDRIDRNGKKRELHREKALDVARLKGSDEPRQPIRTVRYSRGCAREFLCRCRYFEVERLMINTERIREMAQLKSDEESFLVLVCMDGCGVLFCGDESLPFFRGDTIFVPASSETVRFHAKAQLLKVRC